MNNLVYLEDYRESPTEFSKRVAALNAQEVAESLMEADGIPRKVVQLNNDGPEAA